MFTAVIKHGLIWGSVGSLLIVLSGFLIPRGGMCCFWPLFALLAGTGAAYGATGRSSLASTSLIRQGLSASSIAGAILLIVFMLGTITISALGLSEPVQRQALHDDLAGTLVALGLDPKLFSLVLLLTSALLGFFVGFFHFLIAICFGLLSSWIVHRQRHSHDSSIDESTATHP